LLNYCKCGRKLGKPTKKLENPTFVIAVYKCKKCKATYKEAHYQATITELMANQYSA